MFYSLYKSCNLHIIEDLIIDIFLYLFESFLFYGLRSIVYPPFRGWGNNGVVILLALNHPNSTICSISLLVLSLPLFFGEPALIKLVAVVVSITPTLWFQPLTWVAWHDTWTWQLLCVKSFNWKLDTDTSERAHVIWTSCKLKKRSKEGGSCNYSLKCMVVM